MSNLLQILADLSVRRRNHVHAIRAGSGGSTSVMEDEEAENIQYTDRRDVRIVDIEPNIVQSAIARQALFPVCIAQAIFSAVDIYGRI